MIKARGTTAQHCLDPLDVLVLAGGLGTRIRTVLGDTPKLLALIAGRPYLAYLIDWLGHFGARRILLALGHRADAVLTYLESHPTPGILVETVVEPTPLGTAGAIRFARGWLKSDPVMVMNGDSFADVDLCTLIARHRETAAAGTILCVEVEDAGRYGRVVLDGAGRIQGFIEKDLAYRDAAAINAGIYLLSARLLDEIAAGAATSLEREVFACLPAGSLAGLCGRFAFIDIGTRESLARAAEVIARPAA